MNYRRWYCADALMADLTNHHHHLRAASEEEVERRMRKRCRRCAEFRPVAIWGLWVFEPLGKRRKEEHGVG
jgi:hypothetical protein